MLILLSWSWEWVIFIFIIIFSQIVVRKGQEKYFHQEKKKSIYKIESYSLRNLEPSFFDEFCCSDAV